MSFEDWCRQMETEHQNWLETQEGKDWLESNQK